MLFMQVGRQYFYDEPFYKRPLIRQDEGLENPLLLIIRAPRDKQPPKPGHTIRQPTMHTRTPSPR